MEHWEHAYQALLLTPSDLVLLLDPTGRIEFVNATFLQLSGLSPEQVLGRRLDEVLPPPLAQKRLATVIEVANTGRSVRFEDQGVKAWFDNTVYPIFDTGGQVEKVAVIARDITLRKHIEEELRQSNLALIEAERALRQREDQLRMVVKKAPVILMLLDASGTIQMVEGDTLAAANYPHEALIGQDVRTLVRSFPKAASFIERAFSGETFSEIYNAAGNLTFDLGFFPQFNSIGNLEAVFVTAVEITQKISMLKELENARDELSRQVEARTIDLEQANQELRAEIERRTLAEQELIRQASHAQALARAASHANVVRDLTQIAYAICNVAIETLPDYPLAALGLFEADADRMQLLAAAGDFGDTLAKTTRISRTAYEILIEQYGIPGIIPDVLEIAAIVEETAIGPMCARTIISIPLFSDGELFGCLNVASIGEVCLPDEDVLELLQGLADQARLAILNSQLIERLTDSQRRLRSLSERLVQIQEAERRHMARELHDEIGQLLTSLELNLDFSARMVQAHPVPDQIVDSLVNSRSQIQHLLHRVREMSLDLRPPMLEQLGLVGALIDHFTRFSRQTNIQIDFKQRGVLGRFDPLIEIHVFRIIQEALTNIARHSQVKEARVLLWCTPSHLGVKIEDHGRGFDPKEVKKNLHTSGLAGMYERAAFCHGSLEIETTPGGGVSLTLEIPLEATQVVNTNDRSTINPAAMEL